jgi:hypothetical protein
MTRLLEIITALVMVFILAVIVGVALPSSGHIERSTTVSKDIRYVYDVFNNFRRFPDYSVLRSYDPNMRFTQSDKWYGTGVSISWSSKVPHVSNGKLAIVSDKPGFQDVETNGSAQLVWSFDNDWRGTDKRFTIDLKRTGRAQKLVDITWAYDVKYGWNLISRYSGLYIHGKPDALVQGSLKNVGNLLATMPNIDYSDLDPYIVKRPQKPVLMVSTSAKRNLTQVDAATDAAVEKIKAAMKKLGVHQAGPRIRFTTNYGDETYAFDVAIPIDTDTLKIGEKTYTLKAPHEPKKNNVPGAASAGSVSSVAAAGSLAATGTAAGAGSVATLGSTASEGSAATAGSAAAPAAAGSAGKAVPTGAHDDHGRLIVTADVRGLMAFGGKALQAVWYGSPAGMPPTRLRLKAFADTHGYPYDTVSKPFYDRQIVAAGSKGPNGEEIAYDQQTFKIYLPLAAGPGQTPEQAAGLKPSNPFFTPISAGSAPAAVGSVPAALASTLAPAATAPAKAGTAPANAGTSAAGGASSTH